MWRSRLLFPLYPLNYRTNYVIVCLSFNSICLLNVRVLLMELYFLLWSISAFIMLIDSTNECRGACLGWHRAVIIDDFKGILLGIQDKFARNEYWSRTKQDWQSNDDRLHLSLLLSWHKLMDCYLYAPHIYVHIGNHESYHWHPTLIQEIITCEWDSSFRKASNHD